MKELYSLAYLKESLSLLKADIEDLGKWSVYNDDKYNKEIGLLQAMVSDLIILVNAKHE